MASPAQMTANRLNSQHSSGPKTAAGKAASARDATRHGLSAATFHVLVHEDQAEFDELTAQLKREHKPATLYETFLTEQLARSWWLLARAQRLEAKAFDYMAGSALDPSDPDVIVVTRLFELNPNTLQTFQRHAEKAEKSFYRAHRELKSAQANRIASESVPAPEPEPEAIAETERNEPNLAHTAEFADGERAVCAGQSVETCDNRRPEVRYNSGISDPQLRYRSHAA